jgi:cytochrome c oxidase subunit 3
MFFAGLFGIYFTARAVSDTWPPANVDLDMWFDLIFTIILVLSSFTCQFGVWAAERGDVFGLRRWYIVTFLMGLTFIIGQSSEFLTMVHEGTTLQSGAYGTVFYLTTGFHGLHVVGGLIAFILMIARTKMAKFTPAQASSSIVVSYYWHFVDVIWIALFTTIFIIR